MNKRGQLFIGPGLLALGVVLAAALASFGPAQMPPPMAFPGGGAGGAISGTYAAIMNDVMDWYAANNADDMDARLTNGNYIALIHHDLNATSGYLSPTNATYTVSAGRKVVVMTVSANRHVVSDITFRGMRLYNSTDATDIISKEQFNNQKWVTAGATDVAGGNKLIEVAAGKVIELQTWNSNASARGRGGFVILREVSAP